MLIPPLYQLNRIDTACNGSPIMYCIPGTKYVRGILWFSRRYAASASAYHRLRDN